MISHIRPSRVFLCDIFQLQPSTQTTSKFVFEVRTNKPAWWKLKTSVMDKYEPGVIFLLICQHGGTRREGNSWADVLICSHVIPCARNLHEPKPPQLMKFMAWGHWRSLFEGGIIEYAHSLLWFTVIHQTSPVLWHLFWFFFQVAENNIAGVPSGIFKLLILQEARQWSYISNIWVLAD